MLTIITILNTLAIIVIFFKQKGITIEVRKERTSFNNTFLGLRVVLWKGPVGKTILYLPYRNKHKTEIREEVEILKARTESQRRYTLSAKFSWLKTWKEVEQFKKDYREIDPSFVDELISKFETKRDI